MRALDVVIETLAADAAEKRRHTQGVGSPTDCDCAGCRVVAMASLARALAIPDAALAAFRLADAERVIGEALPIGEAQALLLLVIEIEQERARPEPDAVRVIGLETLRDPIA